LLTPYPAPLMPSRQRLTPPSHNGEGIDYAGSPNV